MEPEGKNAAKLYCTFKVHKPHTVMTAPPERPIVSSKGSVMENASQFVTWDAVGLYTNIPHLDCLDAVKEARQEAQEKGEQQEIPTEFIIQILEIILENNIFEFDSQSYRQNIGAAMGCKPIPSYANTFMAKMDKKFIKTA